MNSCIIATQKASRDGYARTTIKGKIKYAHRLAYESMFGSIEKDMTIDHICKTKNCINVKHMEVVTRSENSKRRFIGITHCRNGHIYSGDNLMWQGDSKQYKRCRECYLAGKRRYNKKVYYEIKTNK